MESYRHVLVATDLSPPGEAAALRGADLAHRYQARLTLLHVIEHFPEDMPVALVPPEDIDPTAFLLGRAEASLVRLVDLLGRGEVQHKVIISTRSARHEIHEFVRASGADLLVLAFHGEHRRAGMIGSTAGAVINTAPCDVVLVRPRTE